MSDIHISDKTKIKFKNKLRSFVDRLSTPVQVFKQPTKAECPNCYFDSLTNKSTNLCKWTLSESFDKQAEYEAQGGVGLRYKFFSRGRCPICSGKGYLETQRVVKIKCKVVWNPSSAAIANDLTFTPAGYEGATVVELKCDPKYFDIIKNCKKVVIDGVSCKLMAAPVIRGIGSAAILVVFLFTEDKPMTNSGEVVKDY